MLYIKFNSVVSCCDSLDIPFNIFVFLDFFHVIKIGNYE